MKRIDLSKTAILQLKIENGELIRFSYCFNRYNNRSFIEDLSFLIVHFQFRLMCVYPLFFRV